MTNQEFLKEIQSIQKDILNISSSSTSYNNSMDALQHTKLKLKLLKKGLKTENDTTRKLVVKTYYKKLKRVEKELYERNMNEENNTSNTRVLDVLQEYTVKQYQQEQEIKQEEQVPSMVPSFSQDTEESMEEEVEEHKKQSIHLLDSMHDKETSDYECFNICQIS